MAYSTGEVGVSQSAPQKKSPLKSNGLGMSDGLNVSGRSNCKKLQLLISPSFSNRLSDGRDNLIGDFCLEFFCDFILRFHAESVEDVLGNVVIMRIFFICHLWQKPKITQIFIYARSSHILGVIDFRCESQAGVEIEEWIRRNVNYFFAGPKKTRPDYLGVPIME